MSDKKVAVTVGPNFLGLLTLIFITLKLTGYINWSWWWVLAPLWGSFAFGMLFVAVAMLIIYIRERK